MIVRWGMRALAVALLGLVTACGWNRGWSSTPVGVLLVTLDTTRADRLLPYGLKGVPMPHLERLGAEGVVFDRAASVAPLTLPAHASLFTGLLPPAHGVRDNASPPLSDGMVTLAEVLHARGFRTAAFVGSAVLDADRGLAQGFNTYDDLAPSGARERRADQVVDRARAWLEYATAPFFLWVHLYDPHRPYEPPPPFRDMHDPYVGEIAFADAQLGRLVRLLEERELLDRTIVVVVGDHGESLGQHGERDHGIFLYETVLRIPFLLRAPGLSPGRIADLVRITDVMPTVLELLDTRSPPVHGVSLARRLRGLDAPLDLAAYAESLYPRHFGWSPLYALRDSRFKYVDAPSPELYDLARDPFEQRNVHDAYPGAAQALKKALAVYSRAAGVEPPVEWSLGRRPSWRLREHLAALGYVSGGAGPHTRRLHPAPDPKDCIGAYRRWQDAHDAGVASPVPDCG